MYKPHTRIKIQQHDKQLRQILLITFGRAGRRTRSAVFERTSTFLM